MIRVFNVESTYKEALSKYTIRDGIKAISVYCLLLLIYALSGAANIYSWFNNRYFYMIFDILIIIITLISLILSKESIQSIGITKRNFLKSILLGGAFAVIFATINISSAFYNGWSVNNFSKLILFAFNFLVVAVSEEFVFRGYIQTRIYGLFKNRYVALIVVAMMFVIAHFPSRMFLYGEDFLSYIFNNIFWVVNLAVSHLLFNYIYEKYNCLYGSILFHWVSNLSCHIIV